LDRLFKAVLNDQPQRAGRANSLTFWGKRYESNILRERSYNFADSLICDQRNVLINFGLNEHRSAPLVDPPRSRKERAMTRLIIWVLGGALFAAAAGLMIANAQQPSMPALIAGDHPVTAEQVREKLQSDGWSNVTVSRSGRYIEATGSLNGQAGKMAVDSQTGRLRADDDDDDDD
jgi:hypothetical protein